LNLFRMASGIRKETQNKNKPKVWKAEDCIYFSSWFYFVWSKSSNWESTRLTCTNKY